MTVEANRTCHFADERGVLAIPLFLRYPFSLVPFPHFFGGFWFCGFPLGVWASTHHCHTQVAGLTVMPGPAELPCIGSALVAPCAGVFSEFQHDDQYESYL